LHFPAATPPSFNLPNPPLNRRLSITTTTTTITTHLHRRPTTATTIARLSFT